MRDVKIKPIKIEPIKTMLLIGLASAVMGLSACNKSDSHKIAQTPNIASVPSEDVKVAEEISEQAAEKIPEQITEQGETPMTPHNQAGRDDSAAQSEVRSMAECRALALKSEKLACMIDVRDALRAKNAAHDARIEAKKAEIAAKRAQRAENAKENAALDAELAQQAKTIAALDAKEKALDAQIAAKKAQRAENAKALAAVKAENEQKRIMIEVLTKVKESMEDAE